jgi:hypothetical protein
MPQAQFYPIGKFGSVQKDPEWYKEVKTFLSPAPMLGDTMEAK